MSTTTTREPPSEPVSHLSRAARRDHGRAARSHLPLDGQAQLLTDDRDPLAILQAQDASRVPELVALRHGRMGASEFAFYRGGAALMAHDLRRSPDSGLIVQLCGDAHLSNVGFYASPERSLVFDVNDFDETAPGPFEWDLKRMSASFEVAARARGFDAKAREGTVMELVRSYARTMRSLATAPFLKLATEYMTAEEMLAGIAASREAAVSKQGTKAIAKMHRRDSRQAARRLMEPGPDDTLQFRADPPVLEPLRLLAERGDMPIEEGRARISRVLSAYLDTLSADRRMLLSRYRMVDAAMKVVGVGSVGTRAWLVLLQGNGKRDLIMLQAKEAQQSVLEPTAVPSAYDHQGKRVVQGQRIMQALNDIMLGWVSAEGFDGTQRDFYVRQFRDWKGSVDPGSMDAAQLELYADYCGVVLARAHARSGDPAVLSGYVGGGTRLGEALVAFSRAYADLNAVDYAALREAITSNRISAVTG